MILKGAKWLKATLDEVRPRWGAPVVQALVDKTQEQIEDTERQIQSLAALVDLFIPFLCDNRYVFRCDNTRSVFAPAGRSVSK